MRIGRLRATGVVTHLISGAPSLGRLTRPHKHDWASADTIWRGSFLFGPSHTCSVHIRKPPITRETDVAHPVHTLRTNLEVARLSAVETLAATKGAVPIDALRELAVIQAALTAVREEIQIHGVVWAGQD